MSFGDIIEVSFIESETINVDVVEETINVDVVEETINVDMVEETINVDVVEETINVDMVEEIIIAEVACFSNSGGQTEGSVGGQIFITDVTQNGDSIVSNKQYLSDTIPSNTVLTEATTDGESINIHFLAEGGLLYSPMVTYNESVCTDLEQIPNDIRLFTGTFTVSVTEDVNSYTIESSAGSSATLIVNKAASGPIITDISFIGGYPGSQTEVKENDRYDIIITFDPSGSEPTELSLLNYGACKSGVFNLSSTELNWGTVYTATVTTTIDYTGLSATNQPCRAKAKNSFGTYGPEHDSNENGSVDGVNTIVCNDSIPTFTDLGVTYPSGQLAFKGNEEGIQSTIVQNFNLISYFSNNGDFLIIDSSIYEENKTIQFTDIAHYNDSIENFSITAYRSENNTQATFSKVIEVANVAPTITVVQPQERLRSSHLGEVYTITANSDQNLANIPDVNIPISGTWRGISFSGGPKSFTRNISIVDSGAKGSGSWTLSTPVTNNAGLNASITGDQNVGGFVPRDYVLAAFGTEVTINVEVLITSKLNLDWSFKPNMEFYPIGTLPPIVNGYTIDSLLINPTKVKILDSQAASSSSQESTITIEEEV